MKASRIGAALRLVTAAMVVGSCSGPMAAFAATEQPGLLVDPFVGTLADFGQLSPAAVVPYGMVQLGPDTTPANHAGYDFSATTLTGFSHTRGVGVGCAGAGGDVLVSLVYAGDPQVSVIDKGSEKAHAGFYRVRYGPGIEARLTATRGAGAIRYRLPKAGRVTLTVDYTKTYSTHRAARWDDHAGDLRASFSAGTVCDVGTYHLHSATRVLRAGHPLSAHWQTAREGAASLAIDVAAGDVVEVRTGLSSVDPAAAARVRDVELGSRPFPALAHSALADWDHELSRISIRGTHRQQALFYTALFRVMQTPVAIADPDGRFRDSAGRLTQLEPGDQHYTSWAMWDNYRTQMPLLALLDPQRANAIARSLVRLFAAGKKRWATAQEPFLTVRTEHSGITLLDFYRKGIRDFDTAAALAGMAAESPTLARATPDEQIEAAYDDWAIAELAGEMDDTALARHHRALATSYRSMWLTTFQHLGPDADVVKARGLYQGTLAQYRWAPVFDLPWIKETMGERFLPELRRFFDDNLFNMTNQPDIHVPYLLAWANNREAANRVLARYLTQTVPHRYTNSGVRPQPWVGHSFALAPQGFADGMDDDAGTMTAWYVWSVLGLYPLTPGVARYVVTDGQTSDAVLRPTGKSRIVLRRRGDGRLFVNGCAIIEQSIEHKALAQTCQN